MSDQIENQIKNQTELTDEGIQQLSEEELSDVTGGMSTANRFINSFEQAGHLENQGVLDKAALHQRISNMTAVNKEFKTRFLR